ncbi:hypothetical protein SH467x_002279 [Pirellulaceae bacterium SH467]
MRRHANWLGRFATGNDLWARELEPREDWIAFLKAENHRVETMLKKWQDEAIRPRRRLIANLILSFLAATTRSPKFDGGMRYKGVAHERTAFGMIMDGWSCDTIVSCLEAYHFNLLPD